MFSSSEGRVIATASTFCREFLDNYEQPDIVVSKEMLDDSNNAKHQLDIVKKKLQMILSPAEVANTPEASEERSQIWKEMVVDKKEMVDTSPLFTPIEPTSLEWQETVRALSEGVSNLLQDIIDVLTRMRSVLSKSIVDGVSADWSRLFLVCLTR